VHLFQTPGFVCVDYARQVEQLPVFENVDHNFCECGVDPVVGVVLLYLSHWRQTRLQISRNFEEQKTAFSGFKELLDELLRLENCENLVVVDPHDQEGAGVYFVFLLDLEPELRDPVGFLKIADGHAEVGIVFGVHVVRDPEEIKLDRLVNGDR